MIGRIHRLNSLLLFLKDSLKLRTYLVEDSAIIRDNLAATLAELADAQICGYAVGAHEAIDWLAANPTAWDLVIIDIFLVEGSGLQVLSACKSRTAQQKTVVLTNFATKEIRTQSEALGADAVFDKSNEIDDLIAFCRTLSSNLNGASSAP